jgi:hypothetical protein
VGTVTVVVIWSRALARTVLELAERSPHVMSKYGYPLVSTTVNEFVSKVEELLDNSTVLRVIFLWLCTSHRIRALGEAGEI